MDLSPRAPTSPSLSVHSTSSVNSNTSSSSNHAQPYKTTIIITNLAKDDFLAGSSLYKQLSVADHIKLAVLNLAPPPSDAKDPLAEDYILNNINHWSNIPSLARIIIIFKNNESALYVYEYLKANITKFKSDKLKIHLQENLLQKSKSFDNLIHEDHTNLSVTKSLANFKNFHNSSSPTASEEYNEPEPKQFNVYSDLSKLGIDITEYNGQLPDANNTSSIRRTRSLTKTLFKPDLKINTASSQLKKTLPSSPQSPTITLDESF